MTALLEVEDVRASYRGRRVLHGISLAVQRGEIVSIVGHNGSGKSTLLKAVAGLLPCDTGRVLLDGEEITNQRLSSNVRRGLGCALSGQNNCPNLSVLDNLLLGGHLLRDSRLLQARLEAVWEWFPVLREKQRQSAAALSGGQQQMLALAMALMLHPKLLLLDEPTVGLAPRLIRDLMARIQGISRHLGGGILMVEQNVQEALAVSHRVYVLKVGEVIAAEAAGTLMQREDLWDLF